MNKKIILVEGPVGTASGYGHRSKDIVRSLLKVVDPKEWDLKIIGTNWGITPMVSLKPEKDDDILSRIIKPGEQLTQQPEIHIQITVPNEFRGLGKYNIGITAGIETTACDISWIHGCNKMNLVLVSSEHGKRVLLGTTFNKVDNQTKQTIETIAVKTPVEVLFEGIDLTKFKPEYNKSVDIEKIMSEIPEKFVFLYNGAWLRGDIGQDRKNTGMMVKTFLETFKNTPNPPALLMKTSGTSNSYVDEKEIKDKINQIRKTVKGTLPEIYLLHGHITTEELNDLYNHPKVKSMINFTKGEGFGRPLLEFSIVGKPVMTSNWSGHLDFLKGEFSPLIGGKLEQIHPSAVVENLLIKESQWFTIDYNMASSMMKEIVEKYDVFLDRAKKQGYHSRQNFSFDKMTELLKTYWDKYIPKFTSTQQLVLPKLVKSESKPALPKIQIPKLTK